MRPLLRIGETKFHKSRLVPLSQDHHSALTEAVKDGELWKLWYTTVPTPDTMAGGIAELYALIGYYSAVAIAMKTYRVPIPPPPPLSSRA